MCLTIPVSLVVTSGDFHSLSDHVLLLGDNLILNLVCPLFITHLMACGNYLYPLRWICYAEKITKKWECQMLSLV